MRLKNKKTLLSFLILHSCCFGIDQEKINQLIEHIQKHYDLSKTPQEAMARNYIKEKYPELTGRELMNILRKAAPKKQSQAAHSSTKSDELSRSARAWLYTNGPIFIKQLKKQNVTSIANLTAEQLFLSSKRIFEANQSFEPPFWETLEGQKFLSREIDQNFLRNFVSGNDENIAKKIKTFKANPHDTDKFIATLQGMLDGKTLAELGIEEPKTIPKQEPTFTPGMSESIATESQITTWVNMHGQKIIAQLRAEGITDSNAINFNTILAAIKNIGGIPLPKLNNLQQSMLLGRLGFPPPPPPPGKMPPPPPPKGPKKTAEELAQEEANRAAFENQNNSSTPGKGSIPTPPPPPGTKTNGLLLNNSGKEFLVDAIRFKFDTTQEPAQPPIGKTPPTPKSAPQPKQTTVTNPKNLIDALELATLL